MTIPQTLRGALAGCLATAPMTLSMTLMYRLLPWHERYALPPALITERVASAVGLDDQLDREALQVLTLASHFGYGAAVGALYAPIAERQRLPALSGGIAYGLLVWLLSYFGLLPLLGILRPPTKHPAGRIALMVAAHVVWGAATGLLVQRLRDSATAGPAAQPAGEEMRAWRPE